MKKFTLGVISGMSGLAIAVPIIAQVGFAQTDSSTSSVAIRDRPVPSQECLQAKVTLHDAELANFDAQTAQHKQMLQERRDALAEIANIEDETAREEAMKTMHEELHATMGERPEPPANIIAAMDAVKTACGDLFGHGFKMKMGGHRRGHLRTKMMPPEDVPTLAPDVP